MRLIDPADLVERLKAAKERYQNSDEIVDRAIVAGLESDHRSCFITNRNV